MAQTHTVELRLGAESVRVGAFDEVTISHDMLAPTSPWSVTLWRTATQAPCLIASNTAVTGAPAVLTVYGLAPTTNAETYKILRAPTPAGSNANESAHTHGGTGLT